jgi:glycosyltransferase involved in cell wall biosynthesis
MENSKYIISKNLTIIIPTFNEEKYITNTLSSIYNQNGINGTRVIVSDNHSTDKTRQKVKLLSKVYSEKIDIEIINGGSVSVGRNNGVKISTTKYVLFIDGDSVLYDKNTIQYALNEIINKKCELLTCKVKSDNGSIKTVIIFKLFNLINRFLSLKTPFAIGTFFLTDRNVFNSLGGFDETIKNSEDFCLSKQYSPQKFILFNHYVGQDDRRFKKMGYFNMIKLVIINFINRNNKDFFKKDIGYWD